MGRSDVGRSADASPIREHIWWWRSTSTLDLPRFGHCLGSLSAHARGSWAQDSPKGKGSFGGTQEVTRVKIKVSLSFSQARLQGCSSSRINLRAFFQQCSIFHSPTLAGGITDGHEVRHHSHGVMAGHEECSTLGRAIHSYGMMAWLNASSILCTVGHDVFNTLKSGWVPAPPQDVGHHINTLLSGWVPASPQDVGHHTTTTTTTPHTNCVHSVSSNLMGSGGSNQSLMGIKEHSGEDIVGIYSYSTDSSSVALCLDE